VYAVLNVKGCLLGRTRLNTPKRNNYLNSEVWDVGSQAQNNPALTFQAVRLTSERMDKEVKIEGQQAPPR
jgi:hypothetical protein